MTKSPRGRVIIISNEYFTDQKLKPRHGTKVDVTNVTKLFQELRFTVPKAHEDLTVQV